MKEYKSKQCEVLTTLKKDITRKHYFKIRMMTEQLYYFCKKFKIRWGNKGILGEKASRQPSDSKVCSNKHI